MPKRGPMRGNSCFQFFSQVCSEEYSICITYGIIQHRFSFMHTTTNQCESGVLLLRGMTNQRALATLRLSLTRLSQNTYIKRHETCRLLTGEGARMPGTASSLGHIVGFKKFRNLHYSHTFFALFSHFFCYSSGHSLANLYTRIT